MESVRRMAEPATVSTALEECENRRMTWLYLRPEAPRCGAVVRCKTTPTGLEERRHVRVCDVDTGEICCNVVRMVERCLCGRAISIASHSRPGQCGHGFLLRMTHSQSVTAAHLEEDVATALARVDRLIVSTWRVHASGAAVRRALVPSVVAAGHVLHSLAAELHEVEDAAVRVEVDA